MSELVWIVLYLIGLVAAIPILAHVIWNDGDPPWTGMTPAGCIVFAALVSYAWPLFLGGWVLWRVALLLEPLIFTRRTEGSD